MELSPDVLTKLERLAAAGIQLLPAAGIPKHFALERDGFVALVEQRGGAFGNVGAAGILSEKGFAPLVHRDDTAVFVAKNFEQPASGEQVQQLRAFQHDLEEALRS